MLASSSTLAQAVRGFGGRSPSGASVAVPKSRTSAIRLCPARSSVSSQIVAKAASERGAAESSASALTANRNPCTEPSSGRSWAGPWVA